MTAITLTELSVSDIPIGLSTGTTPIRRVICFIRGTAANADQTLNVATYISGAADIEGIFYRSKTDAIETTGPTWSTTTLTFTGSTGAAATVVEVGIIVRMT